MLVPATDPSSWKCSPIAIAATRCPIRPNTGPRKKCRKCGPSTIRSSRSAIGLKRRALPARTISRRSTRRSAGSSTKPLNLRRPIQSPTRRSCGRTSMPSRSRRGHEMPTPVLMPALSPTMEEGKLAKWVAKEGDEIKAGDVIAEIETDKATMEVEAVDEGRLGKILVGEGTEGVKVNTPIAVILAEGEDESALQGGGAGAPQKTEAKGNGSGPVLETPSEPPPRPVPGDDEGGKILHGTATG